MLNKFFTIALVLVCSVHSLYANQTPVTRTGATPAGTAAAAAAPVPAGSAPAPVPVPVPGATNNSRFEELRQEALFREVGSARQECNSLSREYREQLEKYNGYCAQAGGGGSSSGGSENCSALIERCQTEVSTLADGVREARGSSESMRTIQTASQQAMQSGGFTSLLGAAGSAYANPERMLSSIQGTCPSMSSKDYNTAYREIKNDIKDVNKRITEERKEILKKQTELEKDQQDITKDSTKAKEKYEKAKLDMERKRQEQSERHFENTQKAQKTLGEIETRAMRLNLEYGKVLADETATTQQYMAYAERNITAGCRAQVQKQKAELLGNTNQKKGSSIKLIKQGTENNKLLQNLFNSCYAAQDQKLQSDLQEKKNKKLEVQDAIKKMEEERQRITEAVANADDSLKQLNTINDREVAKEEQSYMDEINNLQQKLQMAASKFEREQTRSTQELNQLNSELSTSQVELAGLGPRPSGDSESVGLSTATRAYTRANQVANEYMRNCGCDEPRNRDSEICRAGAGGGGSGGRSTAGESGRTTNGTDGAPANAPAAAPPAAAPPVQPAARSPTGRRR